MVVVVVVVVVVLVRAEALPLRVHVVPQDQATGPMPTEVVGVIPQLISALTSMVMGALGPSDEPFTVHGYRYHPDRTHIERAQDTV